MKPSQVGTRCENYDPKKDNGMRALRVMLVSALLLASGISTVYGEAPLAPGKPAGTEKAVLSGNGFVIALGLAAVIAATVAIANSDTNKGLTTPTTSTTGTGV
jgi:hypothetical protein